MIIALAALVTALALVSLAVSVYSLFNAHRLFHAAQIITEGMRADGAAAATALAAAQSRFDAIALELQAMKSQTAPLEILPGTPKPGMNLTRRSHALRLHRRGSSPEHIAASIEAPRQEVELLLKVHEIALNNL
jgi:hypothetical protein